MSVKYSTVRGKFATATETPLRTQKQQVKTMARYSKKRPPSEADKEEAMRIARGTQRPGQTKEQTRLITQGIRKGIEQYKKQQSAKARELDRKLKKVNQPLAAAETDEREIEEKIIYRQHWLPWLLLVLSWLLMAGYWLIN
jgi:flagellar biosynthesis GTPase FlhF